MKRKIFTILLFVYLSQINVQCGGNKTGRNVNHVILVWLKDNSDPNLITHIMSEAINLQKIKTVKTIHVGSPIVSERKIVDSSFDLGIFMSFDNVENMNAYLTDPRHVEFFKNNIEGKTKKLVVYDF
jgi:hypothetical protein